MKIYKEFQFIVKCIDSCKTKEQGKSAERMVETFMRRYSHLYGDLMDHMKYEFTTSFFKLGGRAEGYVPPLVW